MVKKVVFCSSVRDMFSGEELNNLILKIVEACSVAGNPAIRSVKFKNGRSFVISF